MLETMVLMFLFAAAFLGFAQVAALVGKKLGNAKRNISKMIKGEQR